MIFLHFPPQKCQYLIIMSIDLFLRFCYSIITNKPKEESNLTTAKILWLVAFVALLAVEAGTVSLVSIWFAAGALVAMVAALLEAQLWLQIVLFMVVSVGLLLALRPLLKKYITPKKIRTNVDSVIGTQGVVLEQIDNIAGTGRVKLGGMEWSARSSSGEPIEEHTRVRVDKIEGVKVFVTPVEVTASV